MKTREFWIKTPSSGPGSTNAVEESVEKIPTVLEFQTILAPNTRQGYVRVFSKGRIEHRLPADCEVVERPDWAAHLR